MKALLREISLILAGLAICCLAIVLVGWFELNYTEQGRWSQAAAQKGRFLTPSETLEKFGKGPEAIFADSLRRTTYITLPLVALVVGSFSGLVMRGFVWLKTLVSLTPLHFFNLDDPILLAAYSALAITAGFLLSRFLVKRASTEYWGR